MKRKVLAVLFATALTAGMLSGCGSTDSTSDKADQKEESLEEEIGRVLLYEELHKAIARLPDTQHPRRRLRRQAFQTMKKAPMIRRLPVMQRTLHMKPKLLQTALQTVQRIQTAQTENFPMVPRMPRWQEQL